VLGPYCVLKNVQQTLQRVASGHNLSINLRRVGRGQFLELLISINRVRNVFPHNLFINGRTECAFNTGTQSFLINHEIK
jgi:hypothetical protein